VLVFITRPTESITLVPSIPVSFFHERLYDLSGSVWRDDIARRQGVPRNGFPAMKPRQRAFLAAFPITCSVKGASQAARIHRSLHFKWLQNDPAYRAAWQAVQRLAADEIQDEMVRRAMGIRRQCFYNGKPVQTGRGRSARFVYQVEYSDRLLIELLKIFPARQVRRNREP
jgi:hypothetical protein